MSVEEPETPGWDTILRVAAKAATVGLRVSLPGKIMAYDPARQVASVQPLVEDAHIQEDGSRTSTSIPQIHTVPVMFYGPARGRITVPVAIGDPCVLWFSSSSLDQWILRGGAKTVDPRDERRHDLNDAIAMVGLYSPKDVPPNVSPTDVVVHCSDGVVAKIGGPTGTQKTLMADDLKSALDSLLSGIRAALVAAGNTSGGGAAIGTAFDVVTSAFDVAYASSKTAKAEVK